MTIEKLPSGSYRIGQMEDGTLYRLTVDHKPTNAEAVRLMSRHIAKRKPSGVNPTLAEACEAYIESKKGIASPATIRGYVSIAKNLPEEFAKKHLAQISSIDLQRLVSTYAKTHSAKSTKNLSSFVLGAIRAYDYAVQSPKLPDKPPKEGYVPSEDDIIRILDMAKDTPMDVPFRLACYGLRRSEICALTLADLDGNVLTVSKAVVFGEDHTWHTKGTKTRQSTRKVLIDDALAEKIRQQGYIFRMHPATLNKNLYKMQDALGIPRFSIHKMRHFFASHLAHLGFTEAQLKSMGGWSSDVLKRVYTHPMEMDEARKRASEIIGAL